MNQADRIRAYVLEHYVRTAQANAVAEIEVRAGDIHRDMNLSNAMPAVCSALGSNKFESFADVVAVARTGPSNGSNARFQFRLLNDLPVERAENSPATEPAVPTPRRLVPSASGSVVLVSCVKSKLPHIAPARELYTSALFVGARNVAERSGLRWYVLSALYGLVEPNAEIAPYDYTLNTLGVQERRKWAQRTFSSLVEAEPGLKHVIFLAGHRYREFLMPFIADRGVEVEVPMVHLRQGEQLAWLSRQT